MAPGYLDRSLARTNDQARQTDRPVSPERRDTLRSPADEETDFGAHGDFDDRAKGTSRQLWANTHREE